MVSASTLTLLFVSMCSSPLTVSVSEMLLVLRNSQSLAQKYHSEKKK